MMWRVLPPLFSKDPTLPALRKVACTPKLWKNLEYTASVSPGRTGIQEQPSTTHVITSSMESTVQHSRIGLSGCRFVVRATEDENQVPPAPASPLSNDGHASDDNRDKQPAEDDNPDDEPIKSPLGSPKCSGSSSSSSSSSDSDDEDSKGGSSPGYKSQSDGEHNKPGKKKTHGHKGRKRHDSGVDTAGSQGTSTGCSLLLPMEALNKLGNDLYDYSTELFADMEQLSRLF